MMMDIFGINQGKYNRMVRKLHKKQKAVVSGSLLYRFFVGLVSLFLFLVVTVGTSDALHAAAESKGT